jgi:citrate synthase
MIVAAHEAIRNRRVPVEPDPELSHAGNFLWMLSGERPSEQAARLLDKDLILHAEHGSNASSFTARVVISTEADLHAAITAAIAALSGPAHGGAAEDVMRMAEEIAEPERAAAYVKARRKAGEPVTGFGHRVYRTEDPRARHMRESVAQLSAEMGEPKWLAILEAVVAAMAPYARFGVNVNVDFYSGVGYRLLAIPPDLFVPVFAIGRIPGWTVQCLEQQANNILIRPLTLYDGPDPRRLRANGRALAMAERVADQIVSALEAHEVERLYCVPGESYLALLDALYQSKRIATIACRHESGAGFMALAEAKMTGRPACLR